MKILLVPPLIYSYFSDTFSIYPSLGILSIWSVLRERNFTAEIFDLNRFIENMNQLHDQRFQKKIAEKISERQPDVVGFSTICESYQEILNISKLIKEINCDLKIVLGGQHATITASQTLERFKHIDIICKGESEQTFPNLINLLGKKEDLSKVNGIAYSKNDQVFTNDSSHFIEDLDELPLINYEPYEDVLGHIEVPIETGRGCPFKCTYCATSRFWDKKVRYKSAKRIVFEIENIIKKYGVRNFSFIHDLFTLDRHKMKEICDLIEHHHLDINWNCYARFGTFNSDDLSSMRRAGCVSLNVGLETASEKIQDKINKKECLGDVKKTIKQCNDLGIMSKIYLIVGFPQEDRDDLKKNFDFIMDISHLPYTDVRINFLSFLPGTEIYENNKHSLRFDSRFIPWELSAFYTEDYERIVRENNFIFAHFYNCVHTNVYQKFNIYLLAKYVSDVMMLNKKFSSTLKILNLLLGGTFRTFCFWHEWMINRDRKFSRLSFAQDFYNQSKVLNEFNSFLKHSLPKIEKSTLVHDIYKYEKFLFENPDAVIQAENKGKSKHDLFTKYKIFNYQINEIDRLIKYASLSKKKILNIKEQRYILKYSFN